MSSTSSVCSSNDAEFIIDTRIPAAIRRDVDRFSVFANRLRAALDANAALADGESMCVNVHAALEMVNESMRDLFKHPQFKTNQLIVLSLQLVQAVKDLKFDTCSVESNRVSAIIDHLEAAVLNAILNRHVPSMTTSHRSATLLRRSKPASTDSPTSFGSSRSATVQRRHSTFLSDVDDQREENLMDIDKLLIVRPDGAEIAFERAKALSTYCKDLASYVRARVQLEQEHARRVHLLVDAARRDLNKPFMPLQDVFERSFKTDDDMMLQTKETTQRVTDRVVEALESRRKEHDVTRKSLFDEWTKAQKSLSECEEQYEKAKSTLRRNDDALRKARESVLRTESSPPEREASRRRRDVDKRSRAVDAANVKKEESERQVAMATCELRRKRREFEKFRETLIEKLRELIFQCEQTTKACTAHYFKALATLWVGLPGSFHQLSDETRVYQPGAEYMAFLHTLPTRAASSSSLIRSDRSVDEGVASCDGSASLTSLRRNALNPDDENALPDTKRHKKTSYTKRLFACDLSTAAQSHKPQRTVQPSKCAACDGLSILYTVQCSKCGAQWHKACFPRITTMCGQRVADRRTSIFGVALQNYLDAEKREVPLILERSIDQLHRSGLKSKGIYRLCGVKSKIEEICEKFEKNCGEDQLSLDNVSSMNLAAVVKLYLRKLPEPLLTYELYGELVRIGTKAQATTSTNSDDVVEDLRHVVRRLPSHNYETLKLLMLHLNRVSWYQETNMMGASNLATVVTPSIAWAPSSERQSEMHTVQYTSRAIEVLIRHAHLIFGVDKQEDYQNFFARYDIEEPPKAVVPGDESDVEDADELDEDIEDDEEDEEDDDEQIFLPPTPDILKNTRKNVQPTVSFPITKVAVERTHSARRADEFPIQQRPAEVRRRSNEKQNHRGYTTSITINPPPTSTTTSATTTTIRHPTITADDDVSDCNEDDDGVVHRLNGNGDINNEGADVLVCNDCDVSYV